MNYGSVINKHEIMLPPKTTPHMKSEEADPQFLQHQNMAKKKTLPTPNPTAEPYGRQTYAAPKYLIKAVAMIAEFEGHNNQSQVIARLIRQEVKVIGLKKLAEAAGGDKIYEQVISKIKKG